MESFKSDALNMHNMLGSLVFEFQLFNQHMHIVIQTLAATILKLFYQNTLAAAAANMLTGGHCNFKHHRVFPTTITTIHQQTTIQITNSIMNSKPTIQSLRVLLVIVCILYMPIYKDYKPVIWFVYKYITTPILEPCI